MTRFRELHSEMIVVAPDGSSAYRPCKIVWDEANRCYGVLLTGKSQLQGYLVLVHEGDFNNVRDRGVPVEKLSVH